MKASIAFTAIVSIAEIGVQAVGIPRSPKLDLPEEIEGGISGTALTTYYVGDGIGACECREGGSGAAWTFGYSLSDSGMDVYTVAASPALFYQGGAANTDRCGGSQGNCGVCLLATNTGDIVHEGAIAHEHVGRQAIFVINDKCPPYSKWCSGDKAHLDILAPMGATSHPWGGNVEVEYHQIACPQKVVEDRAKTCHCNKKTEIRRE